MLRLVSCIRPQNASQTSATPPPPITYIYSIIHARYSPTQDGNMSNWMDPSHGCPPVEKKKRQPTMSHARCTFRKLGAQFLAGLPGGVGLNRRLLLRQTVMCWRLTITTSAPQNALSTNSSWYPSYLVALGEVTQCWGDIAHWYSVHSHIAGWK